LNVAVRRVTVSLCLLLAVGSLFIQAPSITATVREDIPVYVLGTNDTRGPYASPSISSVVDDVINTYGRNGEVASVPDQSIVLAPGQAQGESSVWTDNSVYGVGEIVTIHISPPVMTGVGKWLIVWKPDDSWMRIDFQIPPGSEMADSATVTADQPGQWRVELWGQVVYPGPTASLLATCTFEVYDTTPIPVVTVASKTIFGDEFSGLGVKVERRQPGHRLRTTLATPFSLELQGLCKFTAKSTTTVGAVRYRFAYWEDETGAILSGSRTLYYDIQSAKTFYAVYGPRQYRLTVEVRNATGARVPGATVEVTQLGQTYMAVTNSRGKSVIGGIYAGQPFSLRIIIDGSVRHQETLTITRNTRYSVYVT